MHEGLKTLFQGVKVMGIAILNFGDHSSDSQRFLKINLIDQAE